MPGDENNGASGAGDGTAGGDETTKSPEELAKENAELKDRLSKLESKDHNFEKLRNMKFKDLTEAEQKKFSDQERVLIQRQEQVEEKLGLIDKREQDQAKEREKIKSDKIDNGASSIARGDASFKEKILFFYNDSKSPDDTDEQIKKKLERAAIQAGAEMPQVNPLGRAFSAANASFAGKDSKEDYAKTGAGSSLLKTLNPRHTWGGEKK